jgi:hypothetical protein
MAASLAADNYKSQILLSGHLTTLAHSQDSFALSRNLSEIWSAAGLLTDTFKNTYRPEALTRVDEMLGRSLVEVNIRYQIPSVAESIIDKQRFFDPSPMGIASLASLTDSYSRLSEFQKSLAAPFSIFSPRFDELTPLLSAQSTWARNADFPTSLESKYLVVAEATNLFDQLSKLQSLWTSLPIAGDEEEAGQAEQAIGIANERLAAAFSEKNPTLTVRRIQEFLASILSGSIHLPPKAIAALFVILLNLVSAFIYDTTKSFLLVKKGQAPRIATKVKREIRKIQRAVDSLPKDLYVVTASELTIRQGPARRTPAVGRLYGADLVWLISTRNQSWSLVEFQGEDGEVVLRGWVFSRYLKPLRGRSRQPT